MTKFQAIMSDIRACHELLRRDVTGDDFDAAAALREKTEMWAAAYFHDPEATLYQLRTLAIHGYGELEDLEAAKARGVPAK